MEVYDTLLQGNDGAGLSCGGVADVYVHSATMTLNGRGISADSGCHVTFEGPATITDNEFGILARSAWVDMLERDDITVLRNGTASLLSGAFNMIAGYGNANVEAPRCQELRYGICAP